MKRASAIKVILLLLHLRIAELVYRNIYNTYSRLFSFFLVCSLIYLLSLDYLY